LRRYIILYSLPEKQLLANVFIIQAGQLLHETIMKDAVVWLAVIHPYMDSVMRAIA
jgi:hypothetical protein